jgi:hypothetical protein
MTHRQGFSCRYTTAAVLIALCAGTAAWPQVSPAEIRDPELKALEQASLGKLAAANREIAAIRFSFPFILTRYAGLDPNERTPIDTRGLEFVKFHERTVLKVTGSYAAAYNAAVLTQNQEAGKVLQDVIQPILAMLAHDFSGRDDFKAFGFEISFHVKRTAQSYNYEGKEILVVVLDRIDALAYVNAQRDSERQEILDRSEIYLNGAPYGLVLGERDPYPVSRGEAPAARRASKSVRAALESPIHPVPAAVPPSRLPLPPNRPQRSAQTLGLVSDSTPAGSNIVSNAGPANAPAALPGAARVATSSVVPAIRQPDTSQPVPQAGQADPAVLQTKYQSDLDALDKEGRARIHFVDYAPPEFVNFRKQIYLQMTLRNPSPFDKEKTSIYRRAAQTFDLFLAPGFKAILARVPQDPQLAGLDITVLVQVSPPAGSSPASEAIEFLCPVQAIQRLAEAEITTQELIDQSLVLVNGVRIALNLQQVE